MKDYYNTNKERGGTLNKSRARAMTQQERIMAYYNDFPGYYCTPDELKRMVLFGAPITSVRRALTNLTDAGLLVKSNHMKMGEHGKMVHTWRLPRPGEKQKQPPLPFNEAELPQYLKRKAD